MDYITINDHIVIHCGTSLGIHSITAQMETLNKALSIQKTLIIDAEELSEIDTAAMQLFLAFKNAAARQNIAIQWRNPSKTLMQVSALLGMQEQLGLSSK